MAGECETITHWSGPAMNLAGRVIQRCSVCGAKLCDSEGVAVMLDPDGTVPEFPTWEVGRLIQVKAGMPTQYVMLADTDRIPADSCIDLA